MRVLLLSDADVFAGTERHMFDLAGGLKAEGIEALIGSPTPSMLQDRAEAAGIRHVAIQKRGLIDWPAIKLLAGLLKRDEIDLIHAHNGRTMLSAAMAITQARKGRAVATQHFLEPDHATRRGPKALVYHVAHKWVGTRLSCNIAISEAVRDAMVKRQEAPPDRIKVVQNGMPPVDKGKLASPEAVRSLLNIPSDDVLLLCAARLEKEKDICTLISAIAEVKHSHPGVTCLVAGAGSLRKELEEQIERESLEGVFRLLGFRDDVLSLMAACDLFVLPSLAEPFGLVLLEAMSLGKPVVATDAGGPREIVVSGSTGLLSPPGDALAMAHAIREIIADRDTITKMGKHGYERYQERFTAQRMSQSMLAVYRGVVQQGIPKGQVE